MKQVLQNLRTGQTLAEEVPAPAPGPNSVLIQTRASLISAGHTGMTRLKVVSLCQPHYSYSLLQRDEHKFVSGIMPCRAAVYETTDGTVYISELNTGRLGSLFGGDIAEVMETISGEQERMFSHLYAE